VRIHTGETDLHLNCITETDLYSAGKTLLAYAQAKATA
jgi:hypothetical protein